MTSWTSSASRKIKIKIKNKRNPKRRSARSRPSNNRRNRRKSNLILNRSHQVAVKVKGRLAMCPNHLLHVLLVVKQVDLEVFDPH